MAGDEADDRCLLLQHACDAKRDVAKIGGVVDLDTAPIRLDNGGVVDTHAVISRRDRFVVEIERANPQVMSAAGESGKRILDLQRAPSWPL